MKARSQSKSKWSTREVVPDVPRDSKPLPEPVVEEPVKLAETAPQPGWTSALLRFLRVPAGGPQRTEGWRVYG